MFGATTRDAFKHLSQYEVAKREQLAYEEILKGIMEYRYASINDALGRWSRLVAEMEYRDRDIWEKMYARYQKAGPIIDRYQQILRKHVSSLYTLQVARGKAIKPLEKMR